MQTALHLGNQKGFFWLTVPESLANAVWPPAPWSTDTSYTAVLGALAFRWHLSTNVKMPVLNSRFATVQSFIAETSSSLRSICSTNLAYI